MTVATKREEQPCDFGGKCEGEITTYTVSAEGTTVVVDLCETHGKPFERAFREGSTGPRQRGPHRGRFVPQHDFVPVD